jgi:hypothetical protein
MAMTDDLMTRCETKRLFKVNDKKEWRWVEVAVADIPADGEADIRCAHCHGAIKIHKASGERGPHEHAKHRARVDADNCTGVRGGSLSSRPVN